ncbi:type II secretion system protein [Thiogranum longum]
MKQQSGFTLIELVAVLVILALLGAMAVPRFADVQSSALDAAKDGSSNAVKSAHSIAIAQLKRLPTVAELAGYVGGESPVAAAVDGIDITINGTAYRVPTFANAACNTPTSAAAPDVACVGSIP